MKENKPLQVFLISLAIFSIIIIGSLPEIQLSLSNLFGLSSNLSNIQPNKKTKNSDKKTETVKVNRVIDGDTIILSDGRTIRYLDMDTPETKKPNTPIMCFGPEASEYNKKLVEGKEIVIVPDVEKTDKYGRELRFVFLIGKDTDKIEQSVNADLVIKGFARSKSYSPNTTYEKQFSDFSYKAQRESLGVWKCPKPFEE
ncbi:MAG: thermonuclease family protein [candidate division SR1 bacterium]|nr:thermonuclease family protein [candidate division SR1 bacterium]